MKKECCSNCYYFDFKRSKCCKDNDLIDNAKEVTCFNFLENKKEDDN